ncbi:MAG: hypothetical protein QF408_04080 [Pirellulales bacterium]|nr:hypothetical protein [Pirellulales bacterium]
MIIDFACSECGMAFKVSSKHAGRTGRCKDCGHRMKIPAPPAADVARTGTFRLSDMPAASSSGLSPSMQLADISADHRPLAKKKPARDVQPEPTSYKLAALPKPSAQERQIQKQSKPPSRAQQFYQRQIANISGILNKITKALFMVTFPCILLLLAGILFKRTDLVFYGSLGVILLCGARIVAVLLRLAIVPFRTSPLEGILFLIPPITLYYMYKYWSEMRRTAGDLGSPIVLLIMLLAAYQYIPFLSGDRPPSGQPPSSSQESAEPPKTQIDTSQQSTTPK